MTNWEQLKLSDLSGTPQLKHLSSYINNNNIQLRAHYFDNAHDVTNTTLSILYSSSIYPNVTSAPLSKEPGWTMIVKIIQGILTFLGLLGNILVLIVLQKHRYMARFANCVFIHQTILDISVCIISLIVILQQQDADKAHKTDTGWQPIDVLICHVWDSQGIYWYLVFLSVQNLVLIALDRYWAVFKPMRYKQVGSRDAMLYLILLHLYSAFVNSADIFAVNYDFTNATCYHSNLIPGQGSVVFFEFYAIAWFFLSYLIPVFTVVLLYSVIIFRLTRNRSKENLPSKNRQRAASELTKTSVIITVIFIFSFSYDSIFFMISAINESIKYEFNSPEQVMGVFLVGMNSCVNPLVYTITMRSFRTRMISTVCCKSDLNSTISFTSMRDTINHFISRRHHHHHHSAAHIECDVHNNSTVVSKSAYLCTKLSSDEQPSTTRQPHHNHANHYPHHGNHINCHDGGLKEPNNNLRLTKCNSSSDISTCSPQPDCIPVNNNTTTNCKHKNPALFGSFHLSPNDIVTHKKSLKVSLPSKKSHFRLGPLCRGCKSRKSSSQSSIGRQLSMPDLSEKLRRGIKAYNRAHAQTVAAYRLAYYDVDFSPQCEECLDDSVTTTIVTVNATVASHHHHHVQRQSGTIVTSPIVENSCSSHRCGDNSDDEIVIDDSYNIETSSNNISPTQLSPEEMLIV